MNRRSLLMIAVMCGAPFWMYAADAEQKEKMSNEGPAHQQMETPAYELRHDLFKSGCCCVSEKSDEITDWFDYCVLKACAVFPSSPVNVLGIKKVDGDSVTVMVQSKDSKLYSERVIHVHRGLGTIKPSTSEAAGATQLVQNPTYDGFPVTWNNAELIIKTTSKPPCSYGCKRGLTCCLGCVCCCCYDSTIVQSDIMKGYNE